VDFKRHYLERRLYALRQSKIARKTETVIRLAGTSGRSTLGGGKLHATHLVESRSDDPHRATN